MTTATTGATTGATAASADPAAGGPECAGLTYCFACPGGALGRRDGLAGPGEALGLLGTFECPWVVVGWLDPVAWPGGAVGLAAEADRLGSGEGAVLPVVTDDEDGATRRGLVPVGWRVLAAGDGGWRGHDDTAGDNRPSGGPLGEREVSA